MTNLLIDDRPIMFLPKLAVALASVERAIILQQIHWLLQQPKSGRVIDGVKWVWGSYEEWCEDYFPMWKPQNLAKHIRKLEQEGLLISEEINAKAHDHTKHYRINYEHERLQSIVYSSIVSETYSSTVSIDNDSIASIYRTKTSSKTSAKDKRPPRAQKPSTAYRPPSDIDPLSR